MLDSPDKGSPSTQPSAASDSARGVRLTAMAHRSLGLADDAAASGDYVEAIAWVNVVEGVGYDLPDGYRAKRDRWQAQVHPPAPPG